MAGRQPAFGPPLQSAPGFRVSSRVIQTSALRQTRAVPFAPT